MMNKEQGVIGLILLVAIVIIAGGIYYFSFNYPGLFNSFATDSKVTVAISQAKVAISPKGFVPQILNVNKGTQVTWTNNDNRVHQLYSDPHPIHTSLSEFNSVRLKQNDTYSFTFEKMGTYTYHDELNPLKIQGKIVVQ